MWNGNARTMSTPAGTLSLDGSDGSGAGTGTETASLGAHETVTGAETEALVTGSPALQAKWVRQAALICIMRLATCKT